MVLSDGNVIRLVLGLVVLVGLLVFLLYPVQKTIRLDLKTAVPWEKLLEEYSNILVHNLYHPYVVQVKLLDDHAFRMQYRVPVGRFTVPNIIHGTITKEPVDHSQGKLKIRGASYFIRFSKTVTVSKTETGSRVTEKGTLRAPRLFLSFIRGRFQTANIEMWKNMEKQLKASAASEPPEHKALPM